MINHNLVITGGMGTGKSTVLNLFEKNGFIVINSDKEVLSFFNNTYSRYLELANDFDSFLGTDFSSKPEIDKKILRPYLEKIENGFPKSLEIVKPYISERLDYLSLKYSGETVVFEIPLLFESKMNNKYNNILVITSPLEQRLERIKLRQPNLSLAQIEQTINSQLSESCKIEQANLILNNAGTMEELEENFNEMLPDFLKIYCDKTLKTKPLQII